jgi:hypothetical protein
VRTVLSRSGLRVGEWIAGALLAIHLMIFLIASYIALFVWPHGR